MTKNGQFLAVFNSAHRVMKAENILKKAGFSILLIPAPRALSTDCGLAIRYDSELNDGILETLTANTLVPVFIYRKNSDIHYEIIWQNQHISD